MQPNVITLGTGESQVSLRRFEEKSDSSVYIVDNEHSAGKPSQLTLWRKFPTKQANGFQGTRRSEARFRLGVNAAAADVPDQRVFPVTAIADLIFSFPVGIDEVERQKLLTRLSLLLAEQSVIESLTRIQEI